MFQFERFYSAFLKFEAEDRVSFSLTSHSNDAPLASPFLVGECS